MVRFVFLIESVHSIFSVENYEECNNAYIKNWEGKELTRDEKGWGESIPGEAWNECGSWLTVENK